MYAAKEAGGNPKSVPAHEKVDESARFMQQAVSDLTATLEKAGGEAGLISGEEAQCCLAHVLLYTVMYVWTLLVLCC